MMFTAVIHKAVRDTPAKGTVYSFKLVAHFGHNIDRLPAPIRADQTSGRLNRLNKHVYPRPQTTFLFAREAA